MKKSILLIAVVGLWVSTSGWAKGYSGIPLCRDGARDLPVVNDQVIDWKTETPNQFKARARVRGSVTRFFKDRDSHTHFEIKIGPRSQDVLEVIYNKAFGKLPEIETQMDVEACGVYITSFAPAGHYQASPSGAIIHWVHINPKKGGEPDGYLAINGQLYGNALPREGRRPPRLEVDFFLMPSFVK